jgi:hypothetical protein
MKVKIEFSCDNAAFDDEYFAVEVANVLMRCQRKLLGMRAGIDYGSRPLFDSNGNTIGSVKLIRKES